MLKWYRLKYLILLMLVIAILPLVPRALTPHQVADTLPVGDFCDQLSQDTNVCIDESIEYLAPTSPDARPESIVSGYLTWYQLNGIGLGFFLNTSEIIGEIQIFDPEDPSNPNAINYQIMSDRIVMIPGSTQLAYTFRSYYEPDRVGDTGFIVVFQSQVVNFGSASQSGETVYYQVDYRNKIILPENAGLISYAPTDAILEQEAPNIFSLTWEYRNWPMDSKHSPVLTEVTYSFDDIYLKFTKILYQNQIEKQMLEDQANQLDILQSSFQIISILAVLAALLSILVAYLIARRKFEPQKKKAKELPRRQATDVEDSSSMDIEIRNLFGCIFFVTVISSALFLSPTSAQLSDNDIQWVGQYEVFTDNTIKLTVQITIPNLQSTFKIWDNISSIQQDTISVNNINGGLLTHTVMTDHILVDSPPLGIEYSYIYQWTPHNISGILVFLDRFWLEFANPNPDPTVNEDAFLKADLDYSVVLPQEAIVYSASPSDSVMRSVDPDGRQRVQFFDQNRQIDAFHDAWEVQVSFSYLTIFEALENLNVDYENIQIENRNVVEYISASSAQIAIFALLGLIAPLLSFLIAFWVFRRRYMKEIERIQQQQEEQILVEGVQIQSFLESRKIENRYNLRNSMLGYYYSLQNKISASLKQNLEKIDKGKLESELLKIAPDIDFNEVVRLFDEGELIALNDDLQVTESQVHEYAEDVDQIIKFLVQKKSKK